MIELLVVVAIIGILAGLVLTALSSAQARAHRIACVSNLKQFGVALQLYAGDNSDHLLPNLGAALFNARQHEAAINCFERALLLEPRHGYALLNMGIAHLFSGDTQTAIAYFKRTASVGNSAKAYLYLSRIRCTHPESTFRNGSEALDLLRAALTRDPSCELQIELLSIQAAAYAETNQFDKAIACAEKAIALARGARNWDTSAVLESQLAQYYLHQPYRDLRLATTHLPRPNYTSRQ